jgi:hypothetical protein
MMCVSSASKEFLGAINTSGHMKDAIYIADVIKRYLIEVGPENVVQVCLDNANVMRKAVSLPRTTKKSKRKEDLVSKKEAEHGFGASQ